MARLGLVFLQHLRLLDEEERAAAKSLVPQVQWCTWGGAMGADYLEQYGLNHTVLGNYQGTQTLLIPLQRLLNSFSRV